MKVRVIFLAVYFSLFLAFAQDAESVSVESVEVSVEQTAEEIAAEEIAAEGVEVSAEGEVSAEAETAENETPPQDKYFVFRASSDKIRMLETDTDVFSAAQFISTKRALVSISGGELQRRLYNEKHWLTKIEYWKIASSSAQSKLDSVKNYIFYDDGKIREIKEENFGAQTQIRTLFNLNGKVRSQRKNQLKDGALDSFEIFTYEYNELEKPVQEKRQLFNVKNKKEFLALTETQSSKYDGENLLETSFYENSVLRVRTVYDRNNPETYIQTTYFDDGFTVRDFYENGVKTSSSMSTKKSGDAK